MIFPTLCPTPTPCVLHMNYTVYTGRINHKKGRHVSVSEDAPGFTVKPKHMDPSMTMGEADREDRREKLTEGCRVISCISRDREVRRMLGRGGGRTRISGEPGWVLRGLWESGERREGCSTSGGRLWSARRPALGLSQD
ncbi:hypothetical protein EYF80_016564 [Liparis tanakae]|uniref:Uncharacterized protein n=1 Tax=Liparis tanakae TaxID=230148 RepID=A0A4Z2I7X7_9TELE|nr:hypothetical protein EYF80_016564 [Liparis tanakae]